MKSKVGYFVPDVDVLQVDAVMPVRRQELDEDTGQISSPHLLRTGQAVAGVRATRSTLETTSLAENWLGIMHAQEDESPAVGPYSSCKWCAVGVKEMW